MSTPAATWCSMVAATMSASSRTSRVIAVRMGSPRGPCRQIIAVPDERASPAGRITRVGNRLERVLRTRTIVLWGAGLLAVAGLAAGLLLTLLGGGRPEDSARLDALKTAANIVVGTGGAAALLLAARRQRSAELDLVQKDHDATERRVTEIYGKAAD